ncbi:hypothetical protein TTHERM_00086919 (macronuclear) [Tetrahymena thermophila SB210]|uniref:Uncharacterized protein n=1 Tax=Tetrahymena thermophila (strain SB210) TaxID=312017 RepID=A4VE82_TETTS|nr:hypothetical protein TTHERM_00086919 [Tetrahymena thermophila SB210]EDK31841.1 hypothetical protein TTHERM_00086919 [Tetrahymena thermophila SB210]|eukprot:XP_001471274.1 hypothetical protein TTHERM_00086919 [Tetrahymena thermophila SB210]
MRKIKIYFYNQQKINKYLKNKQQRQMIQQNCPNNLNPSKKIKANRLDKKKSNGKSIKEKDQVAKLINDIYNNNTCILLCDQYKKQEFENYILANYSYSRQKMFRELYYNWLMSDMSLEQQEDPSELFLNLQTLIDSYTKRINDEKKLLQEDTFTLMLFFILKYCQYEQFLEFSNEVQLMEQQNPVSIQRVQELKKLNFVKKSQTFQKVCELFIKCFQSLEISDQFIKEQAISKSLIQDQINKIMDEQIIFNQKNVKQTIFNQFLSRILWDQGNIKQQLVNIQLQLIYEYQQIDDYQQYYILMDYLEEIILFYVLCLHSLDEYKEVEQFIQKINYQETYYKLSDIYKISPYKFQEVVIHLISIQDILILCHFW